ncbi:MAG: hypothetical protein JST40_01945 [Armatimonadetes bacterium]|nr:hypothetical protein [Armatimonadota bacterium]
MRILFCAGEASGDAYAAALASAIQSASSKSVEMAGIGGPLLRQTGVRLLADSSRWGAIGIIESLKVAPRVYRDTRPLVKALETGPPGLFIPIDFGYANIGFARTAKKFGWKVLYFAPPGSWRKTKQGSDLPAVTDAIITQFPWSAEILNGMGANCYWFGHPLVEMLANSKLPSRTGDIAVLPGSRIHEVEHNLPSILEAVSDMGRTLAFGVAATLDPGALSIPPTVNHRFALAKDVLGSSEAAIVCSGTATLEAAILDCPTVVVYRGSKVMELEFKIRKPKFDYISLPNIILGRPLLPELLQHDASPQRIRTELESILGGGAARTAQLEGFAELRGLLGPAEGISRSAAIAVQMLSST